MTLGDHIKKYRETHKCSMEEFARRAGISKAYISILERNCNPSTGKAAIPSIDTIRRVSIAMNVDFNELFASLDPEQLVSLESEVKRPTPAGPNISPMPQTEIKPRIGRIACGEPIVAEQNIEGHDEVLSSWHADFTLMCVGDSMAPKIEHGDIVAIRMQPMVDNGDIAAVRIGDEATLKRVYLHPDYIELRPINPNYDSIIRSKSEMEDIRIEGKAVGLCRNL